MEFSHYNEYGVFWVPTFTWPTLEMLITTRSSGVFVIESNHHILTGVRGAIHEQAITKLTNLKISKPIIKTLMKDIH